MSITKRSQTADLKKLSNFGDARVSHWEVPPSGKSVLEIQHYPNPRVLKDVPDEKNTLTPPYHWHWSQEEHFVVTSGRFIFTLEGVDRTVSASDPQPVVIPPTARHTFRVDVTCDEPSTIEISTKLSANATSGVNEDEIGINEKFFRNVYSYLDDCTDNDVAPSLLQLLLFLHASEVSLAFPGPRFLANPLSYAFGLVLGVFVGEYMLGYKRSYPEYYNPRSATSKKTK